jgi:membrane-bound lytic murein transglycosylase MltF
VPGPGFRASFICIAMALTLLAAACRPKDEISPQESAARAQKAAAEAAQAAAAAERARQIALSASEAAGDMRRFRYAESHQFEKRLATRLAPYRKWFQEAAAKTDIDWRLLAAMSYQESRWDPLAESGHGALGLMMLTESTAQELGVTNRANPRQSIFAGARYFAQLYKKLPRRIQEPDRTWLAVAAYNVGYGHLEDARVLTQMRKKNPDSWDEVREHLPLLEEERWHSRVKRGYARGSEPVQFVGRVQRFLVLLDWETSAEALVLEETFSSEPIGDE